MHEMSLINNLLEKINTVAAQQQATKVTGVTVWLGAMSHISEDHFRGHFVEGVKGSIAENATLMVEMSEDLSHEQAQDILLKSIDVVE